MAKFVQIYPDVSETKLLLSRNVRKGVDMSDHHSLAVDSFRLLKAMEQLELSKPGRHEKFCEVVRLRSKEMEWNPASLLKGWSHSTIKNIKSKKRENFKTISKPLATIIYLETGIDVSESQSIDHFYQLGFDISVNIDPVPNNSQSDQPDCHELKNFSFEIHEANATATDPDDSEFELDLRIGFDRTRMTIRSEQLDVTSNKICAETSSDPTEQEKPDYKGWFKMRAASRVPLSWVFNPRIEGAVITGRIEAAELARVETPRGAAMVAEITARRDALKVRVVTEEGNKASKSLADEHRDKMCAAVARKAISGSTDEYVIHRSTFHKGSK